MTAPSQLRQTHTVVVLGISQPAFEEISAKLRAADYGHCFMPDGEVDMSGIAVAPDPDSKLGSWKPIASAPRDGTDILLRFGQDGISQGMFVPGLPHPWKFIDTNDGITWLVNHAVDGPGGPSHWRPMPSDTDTDLSESQLQQLCSALGWQGGTFHQVVQELERLNGRVTALQEEVTLDDKLLDQRLQLLREIPACEAHGETCVPHAREWVRTAKSGLDIADRQMFVVLASYGAGSGDIYRPPAGEYGSEEFHEAASWLLQRGYVERGEDKASAFLRVLRRPLVALSTAEAS